MRDQRETQTRDIASLIRATDCRQNQPDGCARRSLGEAGASQFWFTEIIVKPHNKKYFALSEEQIRTRESAVSTRPEGRIMIATTVRWDAVDVRGADKRTVLKRTAKACGPGVALLASMHLGDIPIFQGATEAKEPFSGESSL